MAQELLPSAQMQRRKLLILENDRRLRQELEQMSAPSLGGGSAQASEETGSYGMRHRGGCSCC